VGAVEEKLVLPPLLPQFVGKEREQGVVGEGEEEPMLLPQSVEIETEQEVAAAVEEEEGAGATNNS